MSTTQPVKILSQPGIKRDGTRLEGEYYIDGQWTRWQRGLPRKMGGYKALVTNLPELVRGMDSYSKDGIQYIHLGAQNSLSQYLINNDGIAVAVHDRTPVSLSGDPNTLWQFEHFYDSVAAKTRIIGHAPANLQIDNSTPSTIWLGDVDGTGALVDSTLPTVSGGIVALGPYLMTFGSNGQIGWSAPNNPSSLASSAFVTPQKVIKGLPLRSSSTGPAGIFWSLDSIIRGTWVGGTTVWDFDTLTAGISVLSSQGIIEYDGVFYWLGVDRFLMFNGVVREIPNQMNINWFFDHLNINQRQKVFAYKVPRFGEIWWCFPYGEAEECTHAIIYNVRENTWYDTIFPVCGRSCGI